MHSIGISSPTSLTAPVKARLQPTRLRSVSHPRPLKRTLLRPCPSRSRPTAFPPASFVLSRSCPRTPPSPPWSQRAWPTAKWQMEVQQPLKRSSITTWINSNRHKSRRWEFALIRPRASTQRRRRRKRRVITSLRQHRRVRPFPAWLYCRRSTIHCTFSTGAIWRACHSWVSCIGPSSRRRPRHRPPRRRAETQRKRPRD